MQIEIAGAVVEVDLDVEDAYSLTAASHAAALAAYVDLLRALPPDPVIFDVGANMGLTVLAASIARPDARVIAFEPGPKTVERLRHNTRGRPQVEIVHAAVSDRPGSLGFHAAQYSAGAHVVNSECIVDYLPTIQVQALTIDDLASERSLRPDLIKIDVEGHEPEVLAGARVLIQSTSPLIYMEFNAWTLNAFGGHSPAAFAKSLFSTFDVEGRSDPLAFLHDNLVKDGCVSDLTLKLKPGAVIPSLPEMVWPAAALESCRTSGA